MPSKREDIRRLLALTGNREKATAMAEDMLSRLRESLGEADLPEAFWGDLRAAVLDFSEVEEDLVGIYDRRMSHETVLWALKVLESPEGKAFFDAVADIGQESLVAGAARGDRITRTVMARHGLLPD